MRKPIIKLSTTDYEYVEKRYHCMPIGCVIYQGAAYISLPDVAEILNTSSAALSHYLDSSCIVVSNVQPMKRMRYSKAAMGYKEVVPRRVKVVNLLALRKLLNDKPFGPVKDYEMKNLREFIDTEISSQAMMKIGIRPVYQAPAQSELKTKTGVAARPGLIRRIVHSLFGRSVRA